LVVRDRLADRAGALAAGFAVKLYQTKPCAECPWRTDVAPGRFPPSRFIDLAKTAYDNAIEQFACHKSPEGQEFGCAGFLLNGALFNLGTRFSKSMGRVDPDEISSAYPLYPNYRAMAVANGVPEDHPALVGCRSDFVPYGNGNPPNPPGYPHGD
jgi:hypothetical protein